MGPGAGAGHPASPPPLFRKSFCFSRSGEAKDYDDNSSLMPLTAGQKYCLEGSRGQRYEVGLKLSMSLPPCLLGLLSCPYLADAECHPEVTAVEACPMDAPHHSAVPDFLTFC